MNKVIVLVLIFLGFCLSIPCLGLAQESNSVALEDALKANEFLKEQIKKLISERRELLGNLKMITIQNSELKETVIQQNQPVAQSSPPSEEIGALKKELADTHYNLGVMLQNHKKSDEAIVEYFKVLEYKPDDADVYFNLGIIYDKDKKDADQAVINYRKYLGLNPKAIDAKEVRDSITRLMNKKVR